MAIDLVEARPEIERLNDEIEQRVAERIKELQRTNEELQREISEWKRVEEVQRQSQQQYEALVQSLDGIVWEMDVQTFRFTFVSKQAERILGYPIARWVEEPGFWTNHLHPEDSVWAMAFCIAATQRREDHQFEYRMIAADGRVVWLRDIVTVCVMEDQSVRLRGVMMDITDSKRADAALQRYTAEIHDLYNNAPCGYHSLNQEGIYIEINETELQWLGLKREEVIGKLRFSDLLTAEGQQRFSENFPKFIEQGEIRDLEYQMVCKDGRLISVLLRAIAVKDQAGNYLMSRTTLYDITERKRAEENMLKAKQLTEAILDSLPGVFYLFDTQGNRLRSNNNVEKVTGYTVEEFAKMGIFQNIDQADIPVVKRAFEDAMTKGQAACEATIVVKDGSRLPYYFTGQRVIIDGQTLVLGMGIDISERKRAEEELQEIQRRFSDTLTNVSMIAVMADIHGNITFCNDYLLGLTGWKREEVIGRNWFEMFLPEHEQQRVKTILGHVQPGGEVTSHFENEIKTRSGERRQVRWTNTTLRNLDKKIIGIAALGDDITERKQAEAENRKLLHDLGERIKELTALHGAARILQHTGLEPVDVLQQLAALLPPAFQYPDLTGARIRLGSMEAMTPKFPASRAVLCADFTTTDWQSGSIEVGYIEDCPPEVEGPFLREERALLNTLADMLQTSYDRRQAELAMRESEERFRAIAETIPAALFIYNSPNFAYVNPACETLTGYDKDELLRMEIWEMVHPEMRELARARIEARLKGEYVSPRFDFKLLTKSGDLRWAYSTIAQITFQGQPATLSVVLDITERKRAEEQIKATSVQLRALTASLRSAREEEGTRIAREIHDELGSALTSLRWDMESLEQEISEIGNHLERQILLDKITSMISLTDTTIGTVRRIASELRPSILDDLGLREAIEWQAQQFQARTGICCEYSCTLENLELNQEQSTAVFRIFQETLTNVLRHARATAVDIRLEEDENDFILTIGDNGKGITESQKNAEQSLGLLGMRERAHLIGGEIDIAGVAGQGTVVSVRVPIVPN